ELLNKPRPRIDDGDGDIRVPCLVLEPMLAHLHEAVNREQLRTDIVRVQTLPDSADGLWEEGLQISKLPSSELLNHILTQRVFEHLVNLTRRTPQHLCNLTPGKVPRKVEG